MANDDSAIARWAVDLMPFCGHLGVRDVSGSTARVTTYADWRQESAPGAPPCPAGTSWRWQTVPVPQLPLMTYP